MNQRVRIEDLPVGAHYQPIDRQTGSPIPGTRHVLAHGTLDGRGYHVIGYIAQNEVRDWFFQHPNGVLWLDATESTESSPLT